MVLDHEAEVRERMRERVRQAERQRLAARAREDQPGTRESLAGYGWRLRQAAGFGLVRTGLRLLDARRA
jgi:hypothetical protein